MATVELNEEGHPGHVCFDTIPAFKGATFSVWAKSPLRHEPHRDLQHQNRH